MPLAGGIMQNGYQCGMIWGAALAAGAHAYHLYGATPKAETIAINATGKIVNSFHTLNKETNCFNITGIDKTSSALRMAIYFLLQGGTIKCLRKARKYAPAAFAELESAFSEEPVDIPSPPTGCAALLAQKAGVSDLHKIMASGLAGGIGLSGGGCGALGAAIWILTMKNIEEGDSNIDFKNPHALKEIEKFTKCTEGEFECAKIVGRKFNHLSDHAEFVGNGGCSRIIEALTAN